MTMVYTADGLLHTKVPFEQLVAMNKRGAKVDVMVWEFSGTTEQAAQKRAMFNGWYLSLMTAKFNEPDYPGKFEPDSRYRVLPEDLEILVLEHLEDDGSYGGCPGPDQDDEDPHEVVFHWSSWMLYRLFRHSYIETGFDDQWDQLDREADAVESANTQLAQRRDAEIAYQSYLAHLPPMTRQNLVLTAKPAAIRQVLDFIALMNRHCADREDRVEVDGAEAADIRLRAAAG